MDDVGRRGNHFVAGVMIVCGVLVLLGGIWLLDTAP